MSSRAQSSRVQSSRGQGRQATTVPRPRRPARQESKPVATRVEEKEAQDEETPERVVTLPLIHAKLRAPGLGLPNMNSVPGRVLWLGGLGTLAALGALDWPVAVAIAAGTWVAEQRARERLRQEQESKQAS